MAARRRFASASYDDVSLRDLAADVGVDVAYVHRIFVSKANLFREILDLHRPDLGFLEAEASKLAATLARDALERPSVANAEQLNPLLILIHSLASPAAGAIVSERLQTDVIEPLRDKIGDATPARALAIISWLIGFAILRDLPHAAADMEADPARIETLMTRAFATILEHGADGG